MARRRSNRRSRVPDGAADEGRAGKQRHSPGDGGDGSTPPSAAKSPLKANRGLRKYCLSLAWSLASETCSQLRLLLCLCAIATLILAWAPGVGPGLPTLLTSLDTPCLYLHAAYQAISYRKEVDGFPGTGLLRRFLVPSLATMAGSLLQYAVFRSWGSAIAKLKRCSLPMALCWMAVNTMPGGAWHWLSRGPGAAPSLIRATVHLGEAANKAAGLSGAWAKTDALRGCGGAGSTDDDALVSMMSSAWSGVVFGGSRGAASTWTRSADQSWGRGSGLRAKGAEAAVREFLRYALLAAFAIWCHLPGCISSSGPDEQHPALLLSPPGLFSWCLRAAACHYQGPLSSWGPSGAFCAEAAMPPPDHHHSNGAAAAEVTSFLYLTMLYVGKAVSPIKRPKATDIKRLS